MLPSRSHRMRRTRCPVSAMGDSTKGMHHNQLTSWADIEGLSFGHEKAAEISGG